MNRLVCFDHMQARCHGWRWRRWCDHQRVRCWRPLSAALVPPAQTSSSIPSSWSAREARRRWVPHLFGNPHLASGREQLPCTSFRGICWVQGCQHICVVVKLYAPTSLWTPFSWNAHEARRRWLAFLCSCQVVKYTGKNLLLETPYAGYSLDRGVVPV